MLAVDTSGRGAHLPRVVDLGNKSVFIFQWDFLAGGHNDKPLKEVTAGCSKTTSSG
jgi:hypothetical protein